MKVKSVYLAAILLMSSCHRLEDSDRVVFSGSDTERELVEVLTRRFGDHQSFHSEVKGGGTEVGIQDLLDGHCHVVNASREPSKIEMLRFHDKGIDLQAYAIALDALGIITHPSLGVDSLSVVQLQWILTGRITNWEELGGPDLEIRIYGRNEMSGTYAFMKQRFIGNRSFASSVTALATNREIIHAVSQDESGIGYVGSRFLSGSDGKPRADIWIMNLYAEGSNAYSPFEYSAVVSGEYPLTRPLLQYTDGVPSGQTKRYFEFALSLEGQQTVRRCGYYPITSQFIERNKQNGIDINSEVVSSN